MHKYIGIDFSEILEELYLVMQQKQQELNKNGNSYIVNLCYSADEIKDLKTTYDNLVRGYAKDVNLYYYFSHFCEAFIGEKALNGRNLSNFPISISAKGNVKIGSSLNTILILLSVFLRILNKNKPLTEDIRNNVYCAMNDFHANGATLENLLKHLELIVN